MDPSMQKSVQRTKETFYRRTSAYHARPYQTLPNQKRHIEICIRSSPIPTRCQWKSTPVRFHLKDVLTNRTKLWDLWSRIFSYYTSLGGMAPLHPRIASYNYCPIRPQKSDVLPRGTKTKQMTSQMVALPIRIWRQTSPHPWTQNGSIRCTFPMPWSYTRWRQRQWGRRNAPR